MAVEVAAEARIVTLTVICPSARIIAEVNLAGRHVVSGIVGRVIGHFARLISGAAVCGVGQFVAGERTAEARVITFAIIGPRACVITKVDFTGCGGGAGIARRCVGDFARLISGTAVGGVGQFVAVEHAAETGVIALVVICPGA